MLTIDPSDAEMERTEPLSDVRIWDMSDDILIRIMGFLNPREVVRFGAASRRFAGPSADDLLVWAPICRSILGDQHAAKPEDWNLPTFKRLYSDLLRTYGHLLGGPWLGDARPLGSIMVAFPEPPFIVGSVVSNVRLADPGVTVVPVFRVGFDLQRGAAAATCLRGVNTFEWLLGRINAELRGPQAAAGPEPEPEPDLAASAHAAEVTLHFCRRDEERVGPPRSPRPQRHISPAQLLEELLQEQQPEGNEEEDEEEEGEEEEEEEEDWEAGAAEAEAAAPMAEAEAPVAGEGVQQQGEPEGEQHQQQLPGAAAATAAAPPPPQEGEGHDEAGFLSASSNERLSHGSGPDSHASHYTDVGEEGVAAGSGAGSGSAAPDPGGISTGPSGAGPSTSTAPAVSEAGPSEAGPSTSKDPAGSGSGNGGGAGAAGVGGGASGARGGGPGSFSWGCDGATLSHFTFKCGGGCRHVDLEAVCRWGPAGRRQLPEYMLGSLHTGVTVGSMSGMGEEPPSTGDGSEADGWGPPAPPGPPVTLVDADACVDQDAAAVHPARERLNTLVWTRRVLRLYDAAEMGGAVEYRPLRHSCRSDPGEVRANAIAATLAAEAAAAFATAAFAAGLGVSVPGRGGGGAALTAFAPGGPESATSAAAAAWREARAGEPGGESLEEALERIRQRFPPLEPGPPPPQHPLEGIWRGTYGPHGIEVVCVRRVGPRQLEARKLLGDDNVPASAVSFRIYLDCPGPRSDARGQPFLLPPDYSSRADLLFSGPSEPSGSAGPGPRGSRRAPPLLDSFAAKAQIAGGGYDDPRWIDAELVVLGSNTFGVLWPELRNFSAFRRMRLMMEWSPPGR